jgi:hypothetical protein
MMKRVRSLTIGFLLLLYPTSFAATDCEWWRKRTEVERVIYLIGFFTGAQQPLLQLSEICRNDESSNACKFIPGLRENLRKSLSNLAGSAESMVGFVKDVESICARPELASGFDIQLYLHFLLSDPSGKLKRQSSEKDEQKR